MAQTIDIFTYAYAGMCGMVMFIVLPQQRGGYVQRMVEVEEAAKAEAKALCV